MSESVRSRTTEATTTDENANQKRMRAKTIAGATYIGERKALGEVKSNNSWPAEASASGAVSHKPVMTVRSTSKKRHIYRDSEDEDGGNDGNTRSDNSSHNAEVRTPNSKRARHSSDEPLSLPWRDLDKDEQNDVSMVTDYTDEIFTHLYERERETTATYNYLYATDSPQYLRPSLRAILVDWLVEVHQKFQLLPETLYLAINLMDRFMSLRKVSMAKLQLLAVCSLLIAAKFEEVNLPKLSQYAYITDGACTSQDIKDAETYMLTTLQFNIGWPNPLNFLRRVSKADDYDFETRSTAKFFLEYAMCCPKFVHVLSSHLSAMAIYCARQSFEKDPKWDATFKHYSGSVDAMNDDTFQENCRELIREVAKPSTQLKALEQKYRSKEMNGVFEPAKLWCKLMVVTNYYNLF